MRSGKFIVSGGWDVAVTITCRAVAPLTVLSVDQIFQCVTLKPRAGGFGGGQIVVVFVCV